MKRTARSHERIEPSGLNHTSIPQNEDLVGVSHGAQAVRDDDARRIKAAQRL